MAGVRDFKKLTTWQLAEEFKGEVLAIVRESEAASRDFKFRDQVENAACDVSKDVGEGFLRFRPLVFAHFLDYALGPLGEAESRLRDGIARGFFSAERCAAAFLLARRCFTAIVRLKQSQMRYAQENPPKKPRKRR
jgi:four helix bundle protein